MVGERQWVAGGELGSTDKSAPNLKQIILNILKEGETVTKALKRLKPVSKKATGKRKTRSTAKQAEAAADENAEDQAEKENLFSQLTEAAGELMNLGFEDIYQDTKDKIEATLDETAEGTANRGGIVWHDDGTVKDDAAKEHTMYQRDINNSALSYQESAAAASAPSSADGAQPQIPVPATSTIDETNQVSLAAAQEAGTTASPPVSKSKEDTDVPALNDSTAAHEPVSTTDGPSGSTHTAQANSGDNDLAVPDNAVATQTKAAASPAKAQMQPSEQEAADINQSEILQVSQHDLISQDVAALSAADGVASAPKLELQPQSADAGSVGSAAAAAAGPGPTDSDMTEAAQQAATAAPADTDSAAAASMSDTATAGALPADRTAPVTTEAPDAETAAVVPVDDGAGGNSWKGTGKGPGLGQSQEFSGGPVNFARPKYRHAPYNLPPARGGARFGAGNTWSPRGRASPRGVSSPAGRGYSDPFRSSTMRPQYQQQQQQPPPPASRPRYGQPPPFAYPQHPPPPAYYPPPPQQHFQQQYQPPYPPPQQPFIQQAQYAQPPYTPPPPYGAASTYSAPPPAQPPQYDAQWQNQQPQGQYTSNYAPPPGQPPAVFPGAPPA